MIKVQAIRITRVEGYTWECDVTKRFDSFLEANRQLRRWAETAPKGGGYDKCDFTVTFEDGYEYAGRYDLTHDDMVRSFNLDRHMQDFLLFSSGRKRPSHLAERTYRAILGRCPDSTEEAGRILDTYQIGDDSGQLRSATA